MSQPFTYAEAYPVRGKEKQNDLRM
jgi:hypothetical protein